MTIFLHVSLLLTRTFIWPLRHLAFKKLLSLEGFDARQGMYLDQTCRSKVQQPNVHEHTDKRSERHVRK